MKLRFKTYYELGLIIDSDFNTETEDIIERWFGNTIDRELVIKNILGKKVVEVPFATYSDMRIYGPNYPVTLRGVTKSGIYHIRREALVDEDDMLLNLDNFHKMSNFLKELNYEEI